MVRFFGTTWGSNATWIIAAFMVYRSKSTILLQNSAQPYMKLHAHFVKKLDRIVHAKQVEGYQYLDFVRKIENTSFFLCPLRT